MHVKNIDKNNRNRKRPYRKRSRRPGTDFEILKDSVKTVTKQYCAESSICGLKHLVSEHTAWIERIVWVIILIIGLMSSVSLVWMTFDKYYKAPLVTTQMPEGVSVSKIIFPAVGICSNNRISKRSVTEFARKLLKDERNKKYNEDQMLELLLNLGQLYDLQPRTDDAIDSARELHQALGTYSVHDMMRNLTPSCDDLLVRCSWNDEPRHCKRLFDFRLTVNGYCCTFNYLRFSDVSFKDEDGTVLSKDMYNYGNKSTFDFDQGLKVMLRLNESDDFYYNTPLQGAQLQFSDAYDFPDAPSGSFAMQIISPDVQMTVFVSATFTEASRDIQHVPVSLRKCRFYDESTYLPFYTYSDCMLKCRMQFFLENCNCTPFTMPKMSRARTCDMRDAACLRKYYAQSITVRPDNEPDAPELELEMVKGGIPCPMCNPTCSKTVYSYDYNNVNIYPDLLNMVPDDDRDRWLKGANFTGASLVHVKYARDVADCYGQNVIMKWFDLISNMGSTCGFITGFSFISVLEFIYFFTVRLFREIRIRKTNRVRTASTIEARPIPESITKYRPIYWNELIAPTNYGNNFVGIRCIPGNPLRDILKFGGRALKASLRLHPFTDFDTLQILVGTGPRENVVTRIFWLIFVGLSWYGSSLLIAAQYDAFLNNPISFVLETTYKDWDTSFPSVVVCENDNTNRIEEISDGLWGAEHDFNMEEVLKEIAYFKGITYYTSEFCNPSSDPLPECIKTNFTYYANMVRSKCNEILSDCSWNGVEFDCCEYFRPMDTELGTCFAINTIQGRDVNPPKLPMISNRTTGPGLIKFNLLVTSNVYVLNEEEVPALTTIGSDVLSVVPEFYYRRLISIRNIENDSGARMISPAKRKCRYTDENFLEVYKHYSYTACTVQCRKDAQLKYCNCTNYFMPSAPEHMKCNVSGIICLNNNVNVLSVLRAPWSPRAGLYCNCLPSCTEAEISIVKDFKAANSERHATVEIQLAMLPTERYRRNVVRGVLDLVVSTGGTGGLFLGASILSFVELLYILLIRPFCDIYSQRDDDHWHRKFGTRRLEDNKFVKNWGWTFYRSKPGHNNMRNLDHDNKPISFKQ